MEDRPLIPLPPDNDALLAECEVQTFRSGGKGGQHVNKTESAVRLIHRPSGIVVVVQSERSQHMNRGRALEILRQKILTANYRKPRRKATRVPHSAKMNVLQAKKKRAVVKRLRGRVQGEES